MMTMVEWKKLGDICDIKNGYTPSTKNHEFWDNGDIPWFTLEDIRKNGRILFDSFKHITNKGVKKNGLFPKDSIIISTTATIGEYAIIRSDFLCNQQITCLSIKENQKNQIKSKFLYYLSDGIGEWCKKNVNGGGSLLIVSTSKLYNYQIPIPSLPKQNRIVGILDTFTASIENLKEQIAQRRKQFEYYRDQLLDLEGKEDDIVPLGDVCEMIKGNGVQKADFVEEGIGCIHYGQIYTHYGSFTYTTNKFVSKETFEKARKASKGDIVLTDTSENVEDICKSVAYLGEEDIAVSNHALILKHKQNPKFLSYSTLTKSFFNQKRKVVVGVKVSGIKPEHLAQIKIYLPSLDEQSRIVSILDTFEASIENLEAQLSQREKQYEYYRNKLLSFD